MNLLTGRSCACSERGPRRPLACSGLGVAVEPPCSEFIELFTLLPGVEDCCTAPFSFIRPFALCRDDCDPATPFGPPSFAAWALSAFFLLLKRNAIVPFEAGNLSIYANAPQTLPLFFNARNIRLDRNSQIRRSWSSRERKYRTSERILGYGLSWDGWDLRINGCRAPAGPNDHNEAERRGEREGESGVRAEILSLVRSEK